MMALYPWIALLLLINVAWSNGAECPTDFSYSPCICTSQENDIGVNIACVGMTNAEIRAVFQSAPPIPINRFDLVPIVERLLRIEPDLLADKTASHINIADCPPPTLVASSLQIDIDAFKSSRTSATKFSIVNCAIGSLDWSFLDGFDQLLEISLESATSVQSISTLKILPSLQQLSITDCTGLEQSPLNFPGNSMPNLKRLILNTNLKIDQAEEILGSLVDSATNLEQLILTQSPLIDQVPGSIIKFAKLLTIDLSQNSIPELDVAAFNFASNPTVKSINLSGNQLVTIAETAFNSGNYGNAIVQLSDNNLKEFRFGVFLEVLQEMETAGGGEVRLSGNDEIACGDCLLAWLVRDNPNLLDYVKDGFCSDLNTPFNQVDPLIYGTECTSLTTSTTTTSTSTERMTESTTTELITTTESTIATTESKTTTGITSTTPIESTTKSDSTSNQDDVKTLLYITLGLVGLVLLVLIIGFIFVMTRRKRMKSARSSIEQNPTTVKDMTDPRMDASVQPYAGQKMAKKYPPQTLPIQADIPRASVIVQGPGGKYYVQSNPPPEGFNASELARQLSMMDRASNQGGLRRSYY